MAKPKRPRWRLVRLPARQATRVDAWAVAHGKGRSEAVAYLVELALRHHVASDVRSRDRIIEQQTESQIDQMIDPGTSRKERQRRIHRLTEGPPEFVDLRVDLPRSKRR
jgi:hypothetical protein